MAWYDVLAVAYDLALEGLYRPHRREALRDLDRDRPSRVLDLACGTGQNLEVLGEHLEGGPAVYVGVDGSPGMLDRARRRPPPRRARVRWVEGDAAQLDGEEGGFDLVLCTLGLSVMEDWERAFEASFALLRPGGCYLILDVFNERPGLQGRVVEWMARADLRRRVWAPLQARCPDFRRRALDASPALFGGELYVATGRRPLP